MSLREQLAKVAGILTTDFILHGGARERINEAVLAAARLALRYIDRQTDELAQGTLKQYRSYQKALAEAFPIPARQVWIARRDVP